MPPERGRTIALLGLLGTLAVLAVYVFWPAADATRASQSAPRGDTRGAGPSSVSAPDVHLRTLDDARAEPETPLQRDLFRFKARAPATRAERRGEPTAAAPVGPPTVPPSPALAPIAMRFIGLVETQETARKIAIFSDGRGIYQGREGDIIEGRYRILRIGVESVEMAYLDGRGRQTIRLSGS